MTKKQQYLKIQLARVQNIILIGKGRKGIPNTTYRGNLEKSNHLLLMVR
jgi:hypothetical protein